MAPIEVPWTTALGDIYRASLSSAHHGNSSSSRRSSTASNNNSSSESDCSPSRERWGSVKTWMFGHMLASSFAKVSLDGSAAVSSRANSDAAHDSSKPTAAGTSDWDVCFSPTSISTTAVGMSDWDVYFSTSTSTSIKPCVSASSSSSTLCADVDEAERAEAAPSTSPATTAIINNSSSNNNTDRARHVFDLVRVIGSGSYGTVYLSRVRGTQQLVAIKVVDKRKLAQRAQSERDVQRLLTEKQVLCTLEHPFITKLVCSFETPASLNFVLEYCPGGDLYYLLEKCTQHRLSEPHVAFYAASIALALHHLHERGIVYRDLKPENILLDHDGFIRLADFGFARTGVDRTEQRCRTFCGSADYIAPEVVRGAGYGMAADLWSFGCVVYELLTGFPPFYCPTDRSLLFRKIERSAVTFPPHLSPQVCDLLAGLLHKDASQRLGNTSPRGMADVFAHPFFAAIDWYSLLTKQLVPPLVPKVADPLDTSNFEAQFTSQRVDGSLVYEECEVQSPSSMTSTSKSETEASRYFDDFDWCCADATQFE